MSEDGQTPEPAVEAAVPVEFSIRTTYSPIGTGLQRGSRYSFAPVPTAVEFEVAFVNGMEWVVWVWHTPAGVQRYAVPKSVAEQSWDRLGRALGKVGLEIASQMPDGQAPRE